MTSRHWQWRASDGAPTLEVAGDWTGAGGPDALFPEAWRDALPERGPVRVDLQRLERWDAGLAAALWDVAARLQARGVPVEWHGLQEGLRDVLDLGLPRGGVAAEPVEAPAPKIHPARVTVAFFGEVVLALVRLARGRSDLRIGDLWRQIDQTGPLSLPIVALTCSLVGLMLAYMGGAQLARIGAPNFIAGVVTVGMVRELAGLMTGVILAGRIGAAYAAQLASMQAGEEIDALRALGVNPIDHLVLPRLLALVLMAPLMFAFAAAIGVLAGLPAAVWVYGVPAAEYWQGCREAMTWTHLWIGAFKCVLYAALIAVAGCREGLHAGRTAESVGKATTRAVVKALVWIVAAACGTTVVFQSLGL